MEVRRPISPARRRYQDAQRQGVVKVCDLYAARLLKLRDREVRRVLDLCVDAQTPEAVASVIRDNLSETYLPRWYEDLYVDAGLPIARNTARDLREAKAGPEDNVWLAALRNYAMERSGESIVSVTGTLRDTLLGALAEVMTGNPDGGIELLTREIYKRFRDLAKWQVRRIAQTEGMISMAKAGSEAARTLNIRYTKQWCISGLGNTRESHELMDGIVVKDDEPFVLEGGLMMYPHDPSMGAAAGEIINCACTDIKMPV